jgi:hypothetical protein
MRLLISPFDRSYNYSDQETYDLSHAGLQISAVNTAKVLLAAGVDVLMYPITGIPDLETLIEQYKPTHVVLFAFFLPPADIGTMLAKFPYITFAINCHSNIAFLQSEAQAITTIRDLLDLEQTSFNFHVSGNSLEFQTAVLRSYESPCAYLPNLYFLDNPERSYRARYNGGTLRIGSFGALRPLKNPTVSAIAALEMASAVGADLEFYINVGRTDGWGGRTLAAVRAIMQNLPGRKLIEIPWQDWPSHRRLVRTMHVMLQPSFSETFNIVTADGAAEGIPSVVSHAIEWAPDKWKANPESTVDVAWTGRALLYDQLAGRDALTALQRNNVQGIAAWKHFLGVA